MFRVCNCILEAAWMLEQVQVQKVCAHCTWQVRLLEIGISRWFDGVTGDPVLDIRWGCFIFLY